MATANAFDDLPPGLVAASAATAAPSAPGANAFDDITPPQPPPKSQQPPATAADRVQAAEGGILRGAAYAAALPFDTAANAYNLAKTGRDYAVSKLSGGRPAYEGMDPDVRAALEAEGVDLGEPSGASPAGAALTRLLDKSPITTTQPTRPDDPVSRYLATAASVVPGVLAGGGGAGAVGAAAAPAVAGQYVAESKPFKSDAANNAAAVLTQALGTAAMPRGRAPVQSASADAVRAAQDAGYVVPPATTNPSLMNRTLESVAGKTAVQQHASIENQGVTNNQGRAAMGLPEREGPITDAEIAEAKQLAAPGYDALRNAGQVTAPTDFTQRLAVALNRQSGAARLAPSLRNTALENTVQELGSNRTFDASDAMDTIAELRDRASQAYRQGDASAGRAYRGVSSVLEDAINQDLTARGQGDLVGNFQNARQQFARIASVEENRNPTTGNLQAQKLTAALRRGDYLGQPGDPLRVTAEAAGQAPRAFAEPTSSAASHMNFTESLLGAALGEGALGHMGLLAAGIPVVRWGARNAVLGWPGQGMAVPTERAPLTPGRFGGVASSVPALLQAGQ